MHISLESNDKHAVQSYSDTEIRINSNDYHKNLIVNADEIITDWPVKSIKMLDIEALTLVLDLKPEIIIIGHSQTGQFAPFPSMQFLSQQRIGLECMSIGAACRTYNVLLSELRNVVLGIMF